MTEMAQGSENMQSVLDVYWSGTKSEQVQSGTKHTAVEVHKCDSVVRVVFEKDKYTVY